LNKGTQRYLEALETADRTQPAEIEAKSERLREDQWHRRLLVHEAICAGFRDTMSSA